MIFQATGGGVGKFVDILPGAWPGALAGDGGDDFGVFDMGRPDGRSSPTARSPSPPQLTMFQISFTPTCSSRLTKGHDVGTDGGGSQIDDDFTGRAQ